MIWTLQLGRDSTTVDLEAPPTRGQIFEFPGSERLTIVYKIDPATNVAVVRELDTSDEHRWMAHLVFNLVKRIEALEKRP